MGGRASPVREPNFNGSAVLYSASSLPVEELWATIGAGRGSPLPAWMAAPARENKDVLMGDVQYSILCLCSTCVPAIFAPVHPAEMHVLMI
jgi:hypothetical protein